VERLYDLRTEYFSHFISFMVLNGLVLLAINGTPEPARNTFFINLWVIVAALWGMGVAIHTVHYVLGVAKEQAVEKAIQREHEYRMALAMNGEAYEKPKRDRLILNDDGEVEAVIEAEAPARQRR
jgi:hypothetical protein